MPPLPGQLQPIADDIASIQRQIQERSAAALAAKQRGEDIGREIERTQLPQHAGSRQFQPLIRTKTAEYQQERRNLTAENEALQALGETQEQKVAEYNVGVEKYNQEAEATVKALPSTPYSSDVPKAQMAAEAGYITPESFAEYKSVAKANEAALKANEEAQNVNVANDIDKARYDWFTGELKNISEGKDVVHTVNISTSESGGVLSARGTTDVGGKFSNEYSGGSVLSSAYSKDEAIQKFVNSAVKKFGLNANDRIYVDGKLYQDTNLSPEEFKIAKDVSSGYLGYLDAVKQNLYAQRESLKANYGGTFAPSAAEMAMAPVSTFVGNLEGKAVKEIKQAQLKAGMLALPTAQWESQEFYEGKVAEVSKLAEVKLPDKIQIVGTPAQREQASKEWIANEIATGKYIADTVKPVRNEYGEITGIEGRQNPYYNPIPILSGLRDTTIGKPSDGIVIPEFGKMVPKMKADQDLKNAPILREYTSSDAPLDFRIRTSLNELAANVQSFDVLSKNIERAASSLLGNSTKETSAKTSDYLQAKYDVYAKAAQVRKSGSLLEFGKFAAESPVLQAQIGGYVIGGVIGGGSIAARLALRGTASQASKFLSFTGSKLPSAISSLAEQSRFIKYAGKVPTLIPSSLKLAEKAVQPAITVGGLGYIGYDIATSKTYGEAGAKALMLGIATPYAKEGFEDSLRTYSKLKLWSTPKETNINVLNPKVEAGKETFPTTKAGSFSKFKQEFVTKEGELAGFHATSEGYGSSEFAVRALPEPQLRSSDVPGMYVSPSQQGASTAFLRLSGSDSFKYSDLFSLKGLKSMLSSQPLDSEVYYIKGIKGIQRISGGSNVKKSREFLYSKRTNPGMAYIEPKMEKAGFKGEAQSVLPRDTLISAPIKTSKVNVRGFDVKVTQRRIKNARVSAKENYISNIGAKKKSLFRYRDISEATPSSVVFGISSPLLSLIKSPKSSTQVASSSKVTSISPSKYTPISSYKSTISKFTLPSYIAPAKSKTAPASSKVTSKYTPPTSYIKPPNKYTLGSYDYTPSKLKQIKSQPYGLYDLSVIKTSTRSETPPQPPQAPPTPPGGQEFLSLKSRRLGKRGTREFKLPEWNFGDTSAMLSLKIVKQKKGKKGRK